MPPTVLLRHTLPDGTSHYDWLLARADRVGDDERALLTFRVADRVDLLRAGASPATRLPDHRGLYLAYEGPVSGDRGSVERVAAGRCRIVHEGRDLVEAEAQWEGAPRVSVVATRAAGEEFTLAFTTIVDDATPEGR